MKLFPTMVPFGNLLTRVHTNGILVIFEGYLLKFEIFVWNTMT